MQTCDDEEPDTSPPAGLDDMRDARLQRVDEPDHADDDQVLAERLDQLAELLRQQVGALGYLIPAHDPAREEQDALSVARPLLLHARDALDLALGEGDGLAALRVEGELAAREENLGRAFDDEK